MSIYREYVDSYSYD